MKLNRISHPTPTCEEEIANYVSHGLGLALFIAATPFLLLNASERGGAPEVTGATVFAVTVNLLYLASTLYHALPRGRLKSLMRLIDHSSIFLLIAGTYTPFTLGVLRGPWGWTLFSLIWGLAITGIFIKAFYRYRFPKLSLAMYLLMGWLAIIAIVPMLKLVPPWGLFWIVAGGLAYTIGVVFYVAEHKRYCHFVWHLFVLTGTICHFIAVYGYAI